MKIINCRSMPTDRLEHAVLTLEAARKAGRPFTGDQAIAFSHACKELSRRDATYAQAFQTSEYEARYHGQD